MNEEILGQRLRRARLAAGLSQAEVAEALELPRPAISRMESGQRSVTTIELVELSRLYDVPVNVLVAGPEDAEEADVLLHFRATAPLRETDEAVVEGAIEHCRYYAWLEGTVLGEQRYELPEYRLPRGLAIEQGAYLAEQERRRLALGAAPIPSMIDLLEHEGIKVLLRRFPEGSTVSGCYFLSDDLGPCVVINASETPSRQRFTAAHEYEHFLADRDGTRGEVCSTTRSRELSEMRANAFAASFLLPERGVDEFFDDLDMGEVDVEAEDVVHLAFHFGVSFEAVLWRLRNLGRLDPERQERLSATSRRRLARALGYDDRPGEGEPEPDRFLRLAILAWREGEISLGKLSELLDVPKRELKDVLSETAAPRTRRRRAPAAEPDWL